MKPTHVLSLLVFLLATTLHGAGASGVYMRVTGEIQGEIPGSVTNPGHEGSIAVSATEHTILVPYDPATGQQTGLRQHTPFRVVTVADRSTVPLIQALTMSENLYVELRFYRTGQAGQEEHFYTVELFNGRVIERVESGDPGGTVMTSFALVYELIRWTWPEMGLVAEDLWHGSPSGAAWPTGRGDDLSLLPPSPNPTQGGTTLRFAIPDANHVELSIFDIGGRRVRELFTGPTGSHTTSVDWDGRDDRGRSVAGGVYLVRLSWSEGSATKRVTLLR